MNTNLSNQTDWSDVYFVAEPEPTVTYRTALVVYEESLIKGQFVGRGWNSSGFVNFYDGRLNPSEHPTPQAFWLEMDGRSHFDDARYNYTAGGSAYVRIAFAGGNLIGHSKGGI